jgi:hypothetical protein
MKILENVEDLKEWLSDFKDVKEIFDFHSPLYNDHCQPISENPKFDKFLQDKRDYLDSRNIPICPEKCFFEGFDSNTMTALCHCPEEINLNENSKILIFKKFKYLNLHVLKCPKFNFKLYLPNIIFILLVLNFIFIIINIINFEKNLNDLNVHCFHFILTNNFDNFTFLNLTTLYIEDYNEELKDKIMTNPPPEKMGISKFFNNTKTNSFNEKDIIKPNNEYEKLYYIEIEWDDTENYDYYYLFLIKSYEKEERKKYLIEEELNDLDYVYYKNIEDRKWYWIFWSLFKTNYDFINTFLIFNKSNEQYKHYNLDQYKQYKLDQYKQYKLYVLKILIYINSNIISLIIIILFYYDEKMHLIYKEEGQYNLIYNAPQIIAQDIAMIIFSKFFEFLIDYQDKLINIKINLFNVGGVGKKKSIFDMINKNFRK